jgi:CheY-like chemotaxis protein
MQGLPTILVVEDDHLIQSVVEEALKEGGFETVIASS